MSLKEKDLLRELVGIPSVNPHFGHVQTQGVGEHGLSDFLTNFFDIHGWPWLRQTVHPGRDNVVAACRGGFSDSRGGVMLWESHQDTVGIEGMRIDPFAGAERDGKIWGRGACDNKGGMAAMLTALTRIRACPPDRRPTIILAMTEVIRAIKRLQQEGLSTRPAHPLSGGPTVCVSTIHGGVGVHTVPNEVVIDIDRRVASGEHAKEAYRELIGATDILCRLAHEA